VTILGLPRKAVEPLNPLAWSLKEGDYGKTLMHISLPEGHLNDALVFCLYA
jgi:hypothetical protein